MSFACPVSDQRLVLDHIVRIGDLARSNRFAEATPEMVDAVLQAAAEFAEGELAPLNEIGDREASRWNEGAVTTLVIAELFVVEVVGPLPVTTLVITAPLVVTEPCAATSSLSLRAVSLPPGVQRFRSFSSPLAIAWE